MRADAAWKVTATRMHFVLPPGTVVSGTCLVTGASGFVGGAVLRKAAVAQRACIGISLGGGEGVRPHNLCDAAATWRLLESVHPNVIIHLAAVASPQQAERSREVAEAINVGATTTLSCWARENGVRLVFVSTDHVFDGRRGEYNELHAPAPINFYGLTKARGEAAVLHASGVVLRLGWLWGPSRGARSNIWHTCMERLARGETVRGIADERRSSATLERAAEKILALAAGEESGVVHLTGVDGSPYDLLRAAAIAKGLDSNLVRPISRHDVGTCPRPADVTLRSLYGQ